jgi:hypothetical protein
MSSSQLSDRTRIDHTARLDEERERFSRSFEPSTPLGLMQIELESKLDETDVAAFDGAATDTDSRGFSRCSPDAQRA